MNPRLVAIMVVVVASMMKSCKCIDAAAGAAQRFMAAGSKPHTIPIVDIRGAAGCEDAIVIRRYKKNATHVRLNRHILRQMINLGF